MQTTTQSYEMNCTHISLSKRPRKPVRGRSKASRYAALLVAMAAAVGGAQLATPPSASAISGLQGPIPATWVGGDDYNAVKGVSAECPYGTHVTGGGASVNDHGRHVVRLTTLQPYSPVGAGKDIFYARAEAPGLQTSFNWSFTAYAICANKTALSNYQIVPNSVTSSQTFQTTAARCPAGTVAYSAGASVTSNTGQIGLQLNRTSQPLDISRATARVSVTGYAKPWTLFSFAVCAQPQGLIRAESKLESGAFATDYCSSGLRTHGAGGGGGLTDGGPVWLQRISPHYDLGGVDVALTGPLYPSVGDVVAHQTCAV